MSERGKHALSDLPIPPGEVLAKELEERGMTQKDLATQMGHPPQAKKRNCQGKEGSYGGNGAGV